MDTQTATVEPVEAPVPSTQPEPAPESTSLADHEAQFSRSAQQATADDGEEPGELDATEARDEQGRFAKHRAESQKARAEDVTAINALTKELREKEREYYKLHPDAESDSPRIRALKRQIKALDVDLAPKAPSVNSTPPAAPIQRREPERSAVAAASGATFDKPKPTVDALLAAGSADPYADLPDALADWRDEKRAFEATQAQQTTQAETQQREVFQAFNQRLGAFQAKTPDFEPVTAEFKARNIPSLLAASLVLDDNGPALMYYLAQHPSLVDELFLLTTGKDVTDDHVAIVQRRLKQHVSAATTGSATVARPVTQPPKPPNPVRTGPIRTGDELPGDDASLAEHEKAFGSKHRR